MYFKLLSLSLLSIALSGCASNPDNMSASYVSHVSYKHYSCSQLNVEEKKINDRAEYLYGHLKKEADKDTAQMFVGLVLFWPTLFFLEGGDGIDAAEYSELKGKHEAITKAKEMKSCNSDNQSQDKIDETNVIPKHNKNVKYFYSVEKGCTSKKYYLTQKDNKNPNIPGIINQSVATYNYECLKQGTNEQGKKIHTYSDFVKLRKLQRDDTIIYFDETK